jgi:hypothetical protein
MIGHGTRRLLHLPERRLRPFLCEGVSARSMQGPRAIHLEEPEYLGAFRLGDSFRREWQTYYNEPGLSRIHSPMRSTARAKLKYFLLQSRALARCSTS